MHPRDYSQIQRRKYAQRKPQATDIAGLEVLLHIDSFCLGDTICWASFLPAFVAHYQPAKLFVTTFWPELFESTAQIEFLDAVSPDTQICDKFVSAGYKKNSLDHVRYGMMYAARDSLGVPQNTAPDRALFKKYNAQRQPTKIVIAPESTKQIARWDYLGNYGWQEVIDRLNTRGFAAHNISYEQTLMLRGVQSHQGNPNICAAIQHICESRLFVGLSSGLAWCAWAYEIPVVMIAGFTKPFAEFPCYRVWNPHACNGCFNVFPNNPKICPIFAGTPRAYECHNLITPEMVLTQINRALAA